RWRRAAGGARRCRGGGGGAGSRCRRAWGRAAGACPPAPPPPFPPAEPIAPAAPVISTTLSLRRPMRFLVAAMRTPAQGVPATPLLSSAGRDACRPARPEHAPTESPARRSRRGEAAAAPPPAAAAARPARYPTETTRSPP